MKRSLLFLYVVLSALVNRIYAENINITAATSALKKYAATGDTSGLKTQLNLVSESFSAFTNNESRELFDHCIAQAHKANSPLIQDFHTLKAKWFRYNNEIAQSASEYSKVYDYLSSINKEGEAVWILIDIGNLFYAADNLTDAGIFYRKAEALSDKLEDRYALSVINLNLGLIETATGNFSSAVSYLKKCIALREGTKENAFISHTYIKLSEVYEMMSKSDSVLFYIKAAEQLYYAEGTHVGDLETMPALINMAYYKYFSNAANSRIAEMYLLKAREYIRAKNLYGRLYDSFITEATFELKAGNAQRVVDSLGAILPSLQQSKYIEFYLTALHLLAKASHDVGSFNASMQYYEQYIAVEAQADNKMTIQNSSVAGIISKVAKPGSEPSAVKHDKKDPLVSILAILLTASIAAVVYLRIKLTEKNIRNSELKRELDRQHAEFNERIKKRATDFN